MRKSILFAVLCAIAIVAVACGGANNKAGNTPSGNNTTSSTDGTVGGDDYWNRYVSSFKEGRMWMTKMVTKIAGMEDMVSYTKYEVTKVTADEATVTMTTLDKEKKPLAGVEPTKIPYKLKQEAPAANAPSVKPVEWKEEKVKTAAGDFDGISMDGKNWMMKKYPAITLKMDGGMELVEFKE